MANYLKPQSPLQHKDGDYFYPLTTIDQIITKDNTRLNAELISVNLDNAIENGNEMIITNADKLDGKTIDEIKQQIQSEMINFTIVGGTIEPSAPIENTIWINTTYNITKIIFNYVQPNTPIQGMLWIQTDNLSSVSVAPLAIKEKIELNPIGLLAAYQYVNGDWLDVEGTIYQGGKWHTWGAYIIKNGEFTNISFGATIRSGSAFTLTDKGDYFEIKTTNNTTSGYATRNPINVKNYHQLVLDCDIKTLGATSGSYIGVGLGLTTTIETPNYTDMLTYLFARKQATLTGVQTLILEIPDGIELCYPCIYCDCGNITSGLPHLYVYNMYLR